MQFLKTLFWVAVAIVVVLFARVNWFPVTLTLWGGLEADVKLPVLVFGAFLLGLVPTLVLYQARLWSLRRRIDMQERNLQGAQVSQTVPAHDDDSSDSLHRQQSPEPSKVSPLI